MPQDGSSNYQYPPGTRGITDQTIESEAYNTFLDDLVDHDLNIARPIHRGGTGATDANQALVNLGGEKTSQVVTNYDTHVFLSGSFYSTSTPGQAAPVDGHAFVGIAYSSDPPATPPANLNIVIEARDQNDTVVPGRVYVRERKAGSWGIWRSASALIVGQLPPAGAPDSALWWDSDNGVLYVNYNDGNSTQWVQAVALPAIDTTAFVNRGGDTMTGLLTLSGDPTAALHAATRQYVDGGIGGVGGGLTGKVGKAGDTDGIMTGLLTLSGAPTANLHAATKLYVDSGTDGVSGLAGKVSKAGDEMSGDLSIKSAGPSLILNGTDNAALPEVTFQHVNINRWSSYVSAGPTADYNIARYDNAGALIGPALTASRSTGLMTVIGDPTAALGVATKQYVDNSKITRYDLGGLSSLDITVPASAKGARITGSLIPVTATSHAANLQLSVAPGVFRTAAGEYVLFGMVHNSGSGVTAYAANSSIPGVYLYSLHDVNVVAGRFEGNLSVRRANTAIQFSYTGTGWSFGSGALLTHVIHSYLTAGVSGSALQVLAMRLTTSSPVVWTSDSCLTVEFF